MNTRDKAIVEDIQKFRVLSRDLIADLHFQNVKNKVTAANYVLKRLRRDKYISCSDDRRQYIYFPADGAIKKDSTKIPHFLMIADFYKQIAQIEKPRVFIVEPKYSKGMPEPDIFMVWKGMAWHVEIQRSLYSEKQMKEKLIRYDHYFLSNEWHKEEWQREDKKIFPYLWISGVGKYAIGTRSYRVFQTDVQGMSELTMRK
ncbi:hypothetical protein [Paenibacillus sp. FSL L8-0708]|uniref:hypothetical protein n=1 Tax=Paenibacillus sp. FSL L8-0708 TaxID=2975311 RepID=UPI0030FC8EE6